MLGNRNLSYRDVWVAFRNHASKLFLHQIFRSNRKISSTTTTLCLPLEQKVPLVILGKKLPLGMNVHLAVSFWEGPYPRSRPPKPLYLFQDIILFNSINRPVNREYPCIAFTLKDQLLCQVLKIPHLPCYINKVRFVRKWLTGYSLNVKKNMNKL